MVIFVVSESYHPFMIFIKHWEEKADWHLFNSSAGKKRHFPYHPHHVLINICWLDRFATCSVGNQMAVSFGERNYNSTVKKEAEALLSVLQLLLHANAQETRVWFPFDVSLPDCSILRSAKTEYQHQRRGVSAQLMASERRPSHLALITHSH